MGQTARCDEKKQIVEYHASFPLDEPSFGFSSKLFEAIDIPLFEASSFRSRPANAPCGNRGGLEPRIFRCIC